MEEERSLKFLKTKIKSQKVGRKTRKNKERNEKNEITLLW